MKSDKERGEERSEGLSCNPSRRRKKREGGEKVFQVFLREVMGAGWG